MDTTSTTLVTQKTTFTTFYEARKAGEPVQLLKQESWKNGESTGNIKPSSERYKLHNWQPLQTAHKIFKAFELFQDVIVVQDLLPNPFTYGCLLSLVYL